MHGGRAKPTQLSKDILRSKYAITRVVDSLELRGLVKREPFGEDLRTRDIVITKRGIEVTNICIDYVQSCIMPKVFKTMTQEQIMDLHLMIQRIDHYLKNTMASALKITK
jgi:DNA-binding MarR family transcriptional regulator